jgi:hypothetical protein
MNEDAVGKSTPYPTPLNQLGLKALILRMRITLKPHVAHKSSKKAYNSGVLLAPLAYRLLNNEQTKLEVLLSISRLAP